MLGLIFIVHFLGEFLLTGDFALREKNFHVRSIFSFISFFFFNVLDGSYNLTAFEISW